MVRLQIGNTAEDQRRDGARRHNDSTCRPSFAPRSTRRQTRIRRMLRQTYNVNK